VFSCGMQVVKMKEYFKDLVPVSLLESVPLPNLEDEIHFKGVEL